MADVKREHCATALLLLETRREEGILGTQDRESMWKEWENYEGLGMNLRIILNKILQSPILFYWKYLS